MKLSVLLPTPPSRPQSVSLAHLSSHCHALVLTFHNKAAFRSLRNDLHRRKTFFHAHLRSWKKRLIPRPTCEDSPQNVRFTDERPYEQYGLLVLVCLFAFAPQIVDLFIMLLIKPIFTFEKVVLKQLL